MDALTSGVREYRSVVTSGPEEVFNFDFRGWIRPSVREDFPEKRK